MIKVQLINGGIMPEYKTLGANGFDIATPKAFSLEPGKIKAVPLGICFDIPTGWYIKMYGRSSTFVRHGCIVPVTIIDTDYKKEVHGIIYNCTKELKFFDAGTRLWQGTLEIHQIAKFYQVNTVEDNNRGGCGSTGL